MKKSFLLGIVIAITGCHSLPPYYYLSRNSGEKISDKKVMVLDVGGSLTNSKLAQATQHVLENNGTKAVLFDEDLKNIKKNYKKPDYVAMGYIGQTSWQSVETIPVWGRTGINSVNTVSSGSLYGNVDGLYYGNGAYSANYGGSYIGNSYTKVNYDYGVTGYQNVVVDNYLSCFFLTIRKFSPDTKFQNLKVVHESQVCVYALPNDDDFIAYVNDIYSQVSIMTDMSAIFDCQVKGDVGVCVQTE